MTAITAVRRNHVDVALGDVIGSSVFNILFVFGSTSLIRPFYINKEVLQLDVMVFGVREKIKKENLLLKWYVHSTKGSECDSTRKTN